MTDFHMRTSWQFRSFTKIFGKLQIRKQNLCANSSKKITSFDLPCAGKPDTLSGSGYERLSCIVKKKCFHFNFSEVPWFPTRLPSYP